MLLGFPDGSTSTIEYLARASAKLPKERFEVSGVGTTAVCDNFRSTRVFGGPDRKLRSVNQDKGQAAAVAEVVDRVRGSTIRRPSQAREEHGCARQLPFPVGLDPIFAPPPPRGWYRVSRPEVSICSGEIPIRSHRGWFERRTISRDTATFRG